MRCAVLALCLVACTSDSYDIATCSFGAAEADCTPIPVPDTPRAEFIGSFTLVNPNPGVPPGCTGTVDLTVRSNSAEWTAEELDAASCDPVGAPLDGSVSIDAGQTIDLHFPQASFTFRIRIAPT